MKKITLSFITVLICIVSIKAQVNRVLDDFPKIYRPYSLQDREVKGTFEFIELPEPLKVSTVNFSLEIAKLPNYLLQPDIDWEIAIRFDNNTVELLSDTLLSWSAPHAVGDSLTGTIRIKPRASGIQGFTLSITTISNDFGIKWFLDENGNLLATDHSFTSTRGFDFLNTYFHENDSIHLSNTHLSKNVPFNHKITIKPLPKIGDTSIVYLSLVSNKNYPLGLDLDLQLTNLDVITIPDPIDYQISENQTLDLQLKIVPDSVNYNHRFALYVYNDISDRTDFKHHYQMLLNFIFNEDGTLRFYSDQAFNFHTDVKYRLKSYKSPEDTKQKDIVLLKDGTINIIE